MASLREKVLAIYAAFEPSRHANEVAYWLDAGYTSRAQVDELIARVAEHRGREAAEKLRQGMREEWQRRQARRGRGP